MKTLFAPAACCVLLGIVAYSIATEYTHYNAWFNENILYANQLSTKLSNMGIPNIISNNFDILVQDKQLLPNISTDRTGKEKASILHIPVHAKYLETVIDTIVNLCQKDPLTSNRILSLTIRAIKNTAQEIDITPLQPSITFTTTSPDESKMLLERVNQELKELALEPTL